MNDAEWTQLDETGVFVQLERLKVGFTKGVASWWTIESDYSGFLQMESIWMLDCARNLCK